MSNHPDRMDMLIFQKIKLFRLALGRHKILQTIIIIIINNYYKQFFVINLMN